MTDYIQYGCGFSSPEGWRNFDASPTLRFERLPVVGQLYSRNGNRFPSGVEYGDIVSGLPVAPETCSGVYCSHVLEHLALSDFRTALQNTHKVLKPGGIFRFVLPDLELMIRQYGEDSTPQAAITFMKSTILGSENRSRGIRSFFRDWLGNSRHLWMWDYAGIAEELDAAGFTDIRRAEFGDSEDTSFANVEEFDRWEDALGVECAKPIAEVSQAA